MHNPALYGIVPAVITPFHEDGGLDIDSLEKLLEYLISGGVHGLFIAGFTGEGAALTETLLRQLIRHTVRIVGGRLPLCAGVLEQSAERVIDVANRIYDEGISLLSATAPFSPPIPTQDDIVAHFERITSKTKARWMVYGNSGMLTNIEPGTFHRLAQMEGVVAIKDTRPDYEGHLKNLMATQNDDVSLLCGGEYLVGPGLLMGAKGNISGATNVFPRMFVSLYDAAQRGDIPTVRAQAEAIAQVHGITSGNQACWLAAFKYACARLGLMREYCLCPSQPLSTDAKGRVDRVLEKFNENHT